MRMETSTLLDTLGMPHVPCTSTMRISKGVQRIISVEADQAGVLTNLIDNNSCERERFTTRMCAAAQCCRRVL